MRQAWERSALLQNQRKDDIMLLRVGSFRLFLHEAISKYPQPIQEHIPSHTESTFSKYDALSTERLLALTDSKFQELSEDAWFGVKGRQALNFLIELAGLTMTDADSLDPSNTPQAAVSPNTPSVSGDLKVQLHKSPTK